MLLKQQGMTKSCRETIFRKKVSVPHHYVFIAALFFLEECHSLAFGTQLDVDCSVNAVVSELDFCLLLATAVCPPSMQRNHTPAWPPESIIKGQLQRH